MRDDFNKAFEKMLRGDDDKPTAILASPWAPPGTFIQPQDGDVGRLRAQVLRLERRINELGNERLFLQGRVDALERLVEGLNELLAMVPAPVPEWIRKHLKFLIFVCHPDRNVGKQEAAEVTRELLALRGK